MAVTVPRNFGVAEHDAREQGQRDAAGDFLREAHGGANGMIYKSAGEDDALDLKSPAREHRPHNLRTEGFAEEPAAGDFAFGQRGFNIRGVIVEGPFQRARVGGFDEAHAIAEGAFETADEGPIAVQARQVNQCRLRGVALDAQLKLFRHAYLSLEFVALSRK